MKSFSNVKNSDDKVLNFVSAMTDKTYKKRIVWEFIDAPEVLTQATSNHIGLVYTAHVKDKKFVIYEEKFQAYSVDFDQLYWSNTYVLSIVNKDFLPIHVVCTGTSMLSDLFNAVTAQVSGVEEIIDSLLDDLDDL